MFLSHIVDFVRTYVNALSDSLSVAHPEYRLTALQKYWLGFCLTGLLLSNRVNWSAYSRLSVGSYKLGALSWMFRKSSIAFELLFQRSIFEILRVYGQTEGHLIFDDTDNAADFKGYFPNFVILSIQGDCFFGTQEWTSGMLLVYPKTQVISQLKSNQIIKYQNKEVSLTTYFSQRCHLFTSVARRCFHCGLETI